MYMEVAKEVSRDTVFGFIERRRYYFTASRHTTWQWRGIELDRAEGQPIPSAWSPFSFEPWVTWELRLDIGRLNIRGKWRNGKAD
jgi:hypothetical protein